MQLAVCYILAVDVLCCMSALLTHPMFTAAACASPSMPLTQPTTPMLTTPCFWTAWVLHEHHVGSALHSAASGSGCFVLYACITDVPDLRFCSLPIFINATDPANKTNADNSMFPGQPGCCMVISSVGNVV